MTDRQPTKRLRFTAEQNQGQKWLQFFMTMKGRALVAFLSTPDMLLLLDALYDPDKRGLRRMYREAHPDAKQQDVQAWLDRQLPIRPAGLAFARAMQEVAGHGMTSAQLAPLMQARELLHL